MELTHIKNIYNIVNIISNVKLEGLIEISGSNIKWSGYFTLIGQTKLGYFIYEKNNEDEIINIDDHDKELKFLIRNHILNTINEVKIQLNIV